MSDLWPDPEGSLVLKGVSELPSNPSAPLNVNADSDPTPDEWADDSAELHAEHTAEQDPDPMAQHQALHHPDHTAYLAAHILAFLGM